ncbi:zinc-binding dehydrogenase [Microbacterium sp. RD1]|uniref:zinc-binding dehydrogenase n=1 Tax=Microbacterium sp. RD1 TaxID=3457313 RepID=UPI003FA60668
MKALVLTEFGRDLEILDVNEPELTSSGAIIRVEANGICRSDWHLWQGDWSWVGLTLPLPHVMGHEFSGVIEGVGDAVTRFRPGDRVIVPHAHGDGVCDYCRSGYSNVCDDVAFAGTNYWGGYGKLVHIPDADRNLVVLPAGVSFEAAAGLGCRFMTAWHGVVDQAVVRPGEWVAVHGSGGLGLSAIHIASRIGAPVIAVDISESALELARESGAYATINSRDGDAAEQIRELTGGGAHVAVDALGVEATCLAAIASLRKRGRLLQAGLTSQAEQGRISLPIDQIVLTELQVIGTANMPISRFPDMMRMVETGVLDPELMVNRTVGLEEARTVLQGMGSFSSPGISVLNDWT